MQDAHSDWAQKLDPCDREVVQRIDAYINKEMPLSEKLRLARLIALMDLEYDETNANSGALPAREVVRVSSVLLRLGSRRV